MYQSHSPILGDRIVTAIHVKIDWHAVYAFCEEDKRFTSMSHP